MVTSRARSLLFRALPSLLIFSIFLLGFIGEPEHNGWLNKSPLWGPGDPFYGRSDSNLIADPVLIWKGQPSLRGETDYAYAGISSKFENNAHGFRDDEVTRPKLPGTLRILNLGDSATWGLNLPDRRETYSDQLEKILRDHTAIPNDPRTIEVINGGAVGYSSLQGAQYMRYIAPILEPDVVTIYLGNNDPAPSGIKDAARVSATAAPLHRLLHKNFFYLLLQKGLLTFRASGIEQNRQQLRAKLGQQAQQSKDEYYDLLARVSPEEYERNIRAIVDSARASGIRVILLKVPMNLLWPRKVRPYPERVLSGFWGGVKIAPGYLDRSQERQTSTGSFRNHPFLSLIEEDDLLSEDLAGIEPLETTIKDNSLPIASRLNALNNLAIWELVHGDLDGAVRRIKEVTDQAKQCGNCLAPSAIAQIRYSLGSLMFLQGYSDEAFVNLAESRSIWPFAMSPDYEKRFDRVVRELSVEWIDVPTLFAKTDPVFRGSALMHDWVHPNREGNQVIAQALAQLITSYPSLADHP